MYKDMMPDDVQFFIQQFDQMDETKLDKLVDTPDQITPRDLKGFPLEVIAAMNVRTDIGHTRLCFYFTWQIHVLIMCLRVYCFDLFLTLSILCSSVLT